MRKKFKVQNSKFKVRGFTLVELLVSSAIFIVVSTIIVTILFNTFRLSQRTEITLLVKNNGNTALSQMANQIKYAKRIDTPASCPPAGVSIQQITFTSAFDNGQTTLSCPVGAVTAIASNGASLINTNAVAVQGCSFTCSQATINDPPTITIQFSLTSRNYIGTTQTRTLLPFQTAVTLRNFIR
jgi:type II secretory pathway pseudopilin PulG